MNRVEEFLEGYDPNKKIMDLETKKLILNLLFKNIKIAPAIGGPLPQKRKNSFGRFKTFLLGDFDVFVPHHSLRSGAGQASCFTIRKKVYPEPSE